MTSNPDEYLTIRKATLAEIKVKGSRFITNLIPVYNKKQAEDMYQAICTNYYNATHNCFAYRIDSDTFRYSDDGEPTGTAGRPILQVIDGQRMSEVICIVTRYFGGTKLGTGGLIRAYSQAAHQALTKADKKICTRRTVVHIPFSYEDESMIRHIIHRYKGIIEYADYTENIKMKVAIPDSLCEPFIREVQDKTQASVVPKREK